MNTLTKVYNKYPNDDTIDIFTKWFKANISKDIDTFAKLNTIYQLQVFHTYMELGYGLGIHFDPYSIVIYAIKPELFVNELLVVFHNKGTFSNVLYKEYDLPKLSLTDAFERAILKCFEYINGELKF